MPTFRPIPDGKSVEIRNQELQDFADLCKGKTFVWLSENVNICGNFDIYGKRHMEAFAKVLLAGMEVNGEDGSWSGSRWCDFRCKVGTEEDAKYGGRMVRYAFYGADENRSGKPFILQMWGHFYEDA